MYAKRSERLNLTTQHKVRVPHSRTLNPSPFYPCLQVANGGRHSGRVLRSVADAVEGVVQHAHVDGLEQKQLGRHHLF